MKKIIILIFLFVGSNNLMAQFGQGNPELLNELQNGKLYVVKHFKPPTNLRFYGKAVEEREEALQEAFEKNWDFCKCEFITEKEYNKMKSSDKTGNFFLAAAIGTNGMEATLKGQTPIPGAAILTIGKNNLCEWYSKNYIVNFTLQIRRLNYTENNVFLPMLFEEVKVLNNYMKDALASKKFDLTNRINNNAGRLKTNQLMFLKNSFGFAGESKIKENYKYKFRIPESSSEMINAMENNKPTMLFMLGWGGGKNDYVVVIDPSKGELIFVTDYVNKGFVKGDYSLDALEQLNIAVGKAKIEEKDEDE